MNSSGSILSAEQLELVKKHLGYAKSVAVKTSLGLPISTEDAIQCGYEGLLEAARRFDIGEYDPERGDIDTHFKSFAYRRIGGAVYDQSRRDSFVRRRGLEKGLKVTMSSIDNFYESDAGQVPEIQLESLAEDPDLRMDFEAALDSLTERERYVVMAMAVGARGSELADKLGVSESRISQISTKARGKIAERMMLDE